MLTYSTLRSTIKSIEDLIKINKKEQAIQKITSLKQAFIEFLENYSQILEDIQNKKISLPVYKILFAVISELALDIDILYGDVFENNLLRKSRLSLILEKINLEKDIEYFNLVNDIMHEIMNFLEYYYEATPGTPPYSLSKEEIKNKINELKIKAL